MKLLAAVFTVASLLGMPPYAAGQADSAEGEIAVPKTPASITGILVAQRFTLETPYPYTWTKERIEVATGVLVVLAVDPAYVVPRNALEPVLYAGDVPVQRLNHGNLSGRVIGIVPGNIDLATTPIWFGTPELPERITTGMAKAERGRAEKAGVRALSAAGVRSVERPPVVAKDLAALLRDVAAKLVYEFSPQEKELAEAWRLPVAGVPPGRNPKEQGVRP
ncbi:MAG TPA: hypothetical protein VN851_12575 [Thermoanaerobaculia bacterium]|nr:hypothetical protein [Thermoanaerobaculia bacterium]